MRVIVFMGRKYVPTLTRAKLLDVRAMVAHGPAGKGVFMLTVYLRCKYEGTGSKGGEVQHYDVPAMREHVPHSTPQEEQLQRLTFMLNIVALQQECDYALRLPIETKPQPARGRKRLLEFTGA